MHRRGLELVRPAQTLIVVSANLSFAGALSSLLDFQRARR